MLFIHRKIELNQSRESFQVQICINDSLDVVSSEMESALKKSYSLYGHEQDTLEKYTFSHPRTPWDEYVDFVY